MVTALRTTAERVIDGVATYAPSLLSAAVLLAVGWLISWLVSRLIARLVDRVSPAISTRASRLAVAPLGIERRLADVVGAVVFWAVFVVFVGAATEALGLPVLATWVSQAASFLPRILFGGLIVLLGVLLGTLARDAIVAAAHAGGLARGDLLGRVAQVAIVVAAGVAGVEQIGIDSQFITAALTVTIGAALGGAALAFALGAKTDVSNVVAMHYVRQSYRVGQRVALSDVEGRVRELTTTAVVLETGTGHVRVPGKLFSEQVSQVLTADG